MSNLPITNPTTNPTRSKNNCKKHPNAETKTLTLTGNSSCKCCVAYGRALGALLRETGSIHSVLVNAANAKVDSPGGLTSTELVERLAAVQYFEVAALQLVSTAFLVDGKEISHKCCEGYAAQVQGQMVGLVNTTLTNALIAAFPLGTPPPLFPDGGLPPTPIPDSPPGTNLPGTVWGNIRVSLGTVIALLANAKDIATC
uniref:Uncharacterized protein n=1 Tax=Pithovirus LCPAC101 TaxID=2506586 RepID=A0A481Z2Q3_9VIRU|nr:MAG: hypothetical protein LCPAC101_03270 [Pithovirus LCPAC101]